jgi:WD40 repeat protein
MSFVTGCARMIHVEGLQPVKYDRELTMPDFDAVESIQTCAFDPTGKMLAVGSLIAPRGKPTRLESYDVKSGKRVHSFVGGRAAINCIVWSPDGLLIASCDGLTPPGDTDHATYVRVWDAQTGNMVTSFRNNMQGRDVPLSKVAFSPDGTRLASVDYEFQTVLYDLTSHSRFVVRPLQQVGIAGETLSLYFSSDGKYLGTGGARWPILSVFPDPKVGPPVICPADVLSLDQKTSIAVDASRSPADLTEWFVIRRRGSIGRYKFPSGRLLLKWQLDCYKEMTYWGLATSADCRILAIAGTFGVAALDVFDETTPMWAGELPLKIGTDGLPRKRGADCVAISSDGTCLVAGAGGVFIWDHLDKSFIREH